MLNFIPTQEMYEMFNSTMYNKSTADQFADTIEFVVAGSDF